MREGRVSLGKEGKVLIFVESFICWVWYKCFKYRIFFNVFRNFGRLGLLVLFYVWGN